jgi:hypothetical protein
VDSDESTIVYRYDITVLRFCDVLRLAFK